MTGGYSILLDGLGVAAETGGMLVGPIKARIDVAGNLAIMGRSGAGKTLFARATLDLLPPNLVRVGPLCRFIPHGEGDTESIPLKRIVMVLQSPASSLPQAINCCDLIERVIDWTDADDSELRSEQILRRVGLQPLDLARKHTSQLSGGMAQRFAIALSLARSPEIVVLDEPTVGLDAGARNDLVDLIAKLTATGNRFILISHDDEFLSKVSESMIVIDNGKLANRER